MFKSFLISAVRNVQKNKLYATINILGLALGIACCLVIFTIVKYETSFDDYHTKAERIYRVNWYQKSDKGMLFNGCNYSPLAETIREEVSGLESVTGVYCLQRYEFSIQNHVFEDKYAFFVDQHYFDVFDVKWVAGNKAKSLLNPGSVVVTKKFADDYLAGVDKALGATIMFHSKLSLTVTGVVLNPPSNTDHPYSVLISYPTLAQFKPETVNNWKEVSSGATYVVLQKNTQAKIIYTQLNSIIKNHLAENQAKITSFHLLPLNDNHDRNYDYTSFTYDFPVPLMIILSIISGMIAFIACVNFVNLATAQSLKRAREVGIRKTMGSNRGFLILQYLCEAFVITALAVVTGIVISHFAINKLNELYGGDYLQLELLQDPSTLLFIFAITVVITALSGFYPAFVLSGFKPVLALKSQTNSGNSRGFTLRKALVVIQFSAAQILILVTLIMVNQISFFKQRPLGYNPETLLIVPYLYRDNGTEIEKFNRELNEIPGIGNVSFGDVGNNRADFYIRKSEKQTTILSYADTSYKHTFNLTLLAGKNLRIPATTSSREVLVNEALINKLGISSPEAAIGSIFTLNDEDVIIIGVINNTYTNPMSSTIDPVTIRYDADKFVAAAINMSTENIPQTLGAIDRAWKVVYPNYIFRFNFMNDTIDREYGFYNIIFGILGVASFLAIFIGCLGLYGLVSFMALQRTREIGIRKVFGASVSNIILMFTQESTWLLAIAFVIASPLAHFAGIAMLMEFPERISPGFEIFVVTLFGSIAIALITVSYRSFIAARKNPVDSLRTD